MENNCAIAEVSRTFRAVVTNANPVVYELVTATTGTMIKFLENIKKGFKRTISWNKYRSDITTSTKNNNLDYMIDPTFRNTNRLFVLLFENGYNNPTRHSFDLYYIQLAEIKDFNALTDNKPLFDHPVKNKQQAYEKLVKMLRNDKYTTRNLLDFSYHQNYYKLIGIDLSRQTNKSIWQQINFVGKIAEKQQKKKLLNFSSDSLIVTE